MRSEDCCREIRAESFAGYVGKICARKLAKSIYNREGAISCWRRNFREEKWKSNSISDIPYLLYFYSERGRATAHSDSPRCSAGHVLRRLAQTGCINS